LGNQALAKPRYDESVYTAARRLEACALALVECPDRPLIVSLWPELEPEPAFFAEVERRAQLAWRDDIVSPPTATLTQTDGIALFNHVFVPFHNRTLALHLVRALRANVHQVWMGEAAAMECMQNPRCIADDYVPSADPAMIPNTTVVSEKQRGPVDLWRLMVTSWVSAGAPVPRRLSKLCSSADTRSAHAPAAPSRPDMTSHATGASRSRTTRRT
jgi:hypothetical protein